uniref:RNAse_Pc domain-containing protein n=1 Tax=Haemonchus contortus TaxID=6289 RepID=A0A7I4XY59_HAECO|nr:unnamed protein product [Haemonchus contortus]
MHLLFASFVCYVLLLTEGYAEAEKCKNYEQNVPVIAQNALVDAISEERKNLSIKTTIEYDGKLAEQACQGINEGSTLPLDGESIFEKNWNETLKKAVMSKSKGMTRVGEKIGCKITLKTSEDGTHHVNLYCRLGNKNGQPLRPFFEI